MRNGRKKKESVLENGFPCHLIIVSICNFTGLSGGTDAD